MSDFTIARPYAKAVFKLAQQQQKLPIWSQALQWLAQIAADHNMRAMLANPKYTKDQHAQMLIAVSEDKLPAQIAQFVINLLHVLAENKRLLILPAIYQLFAQLQDNAAGKVKLEIISAYSLDDASEQAIIAAVSHQFGKNLEVSSSVDASLIGGVVIRAGDQVIDASIKNRIAQLGAALEK